MTFASFVDNLIGVINNALIPVLVGLLLVFIIWKVIDMLILNPGDEQKRADGKRLIAISVVVMTMIVALWGIVALVRSGLFG